MEIKLHVQISEAYHPGGGIWPPAPGSASLPVTMETRVAKMAPENTIPLNIFKKGKWESN